jgi:hypothetical protein
MKMSVPSRCSASVNGPVISPYSATFRMLASEPFCCVHDHRDSPLRHRWNLQIVQRYAFQQRMADDSRWIVLSPGQFTAQQFRLDLQVKDYRNSIRLIGFYGCINPVENVRL